MKILKEKKIYLNCVTVAKSKQPAAECTVSCGS